MPITALFDRLSVRSRQLKMELLERHVPIASAERILDIGSQLDVEAQQLLERVEDKRRITAANILPQHLEAIRAAYPAIRTVLADARKLPFRDKEFDLVYSSAVIEHVGGPDDQARMAQEVRRVGKRWFITTPNRWYPFEFHTRMPLISWLPPRAMRRVARIWSYSHVQSRYRSGIDCSDVELLHARQLRRIFPDSLILKPRVTFWPETLVVIGPIARGGADPGSEPGAAQSADTESRRPLTRIGPTP